VPPMMAILLSIGMASVSAILLIWLGYPLAIWMLAKVAAKPNVPNYASGATRRVSVVLATRDGPDAVKARVTNLLETSHPQELVEIIVALDAQGATCTPEVLAPLDERVRVVIGNAPGGKAATLNAGVQAATGDVLVMADVAQRFDARTIPELVAAMEDRRFGAVSGALELGRDGSASPVDLYWRLEKWLRYNESQIHSCVGVTGAVYATRRVLWTALPAGTLLDDVYVPMSLVHKGHRVGFSYNAVAHDVRTFGAHAEGIRKTRTLTGVIQLLRLLPVITTGANPIRVQFLIHKLARLTTPLWLLVAAISTLGTCSLIAARNPMVAAISFGALLCAMISIPPLRRRSALIARWGYSLQLASTRAVMNGMRGSWSVWKKPEA
jgi:hypothetical protein